MQDRTPQIVEPGSPNHQYHGDYPAVLLLAVRRFPKGRTLKELMGDIGSFSAESVEQALMELVDLGILERYTSTQNPEELWRLAK